MRTLRIRLTTVALLLTLIAALTAGPASAQKPGGKGAAIVGASFEATLTVRGGGAPEGPLLRITGRANITGESAVRLESPDPDEPAFASS